MAVTSRFLIVKQNKEKNSKSINGIEGYNLTTKSNVHFADGIDISKLIITEPNFIDKVASSKIKSKFERFVNMVQVVCEAGDEDDSGEGYRIALNEGEKLKMELWNKYKKFISNEKLELMTKKIEILEDEMKLRLEILIENKYKEDEKEKGHSR